MQPTAIDCQSFAGGFALGIVQAGFELIAKREYPGGFGSEAMLANRHLLGDSWELEACDPKDWSPKQADLVFGNPPCSGFSNRSVMVRGLLEDGSFGNLKIRGANSKVNECMWALVEYAAECDPKIVIFESVQGAYTSGRSLMTDLRQELEELTGEKWNLYHVLHNASDLGGAQVRQRYFWVASRIPFGVDPVFMPPTSVRDRISDLADQDLGTIEGHEVAQTPRLHRIKELADKSVWLEGETSGEAFRRAELANVDLDLWSEPLVSDKGVTQFAPKRLRYDTPSRVLAGDALSTVVHPIKSRPLTHREVARLSGFPDDWITTPYRVKLNNSCWWGKGVTVEAGRWIAQAAFDAITGSPQEFQGELIGEREYLIAANNKERIESANQPLFDEMEIQQ